LSLSAVRSRQEALKWWRNNPAAVRGTTLIVSHEEPSNLTVPVRRRFGQKLYLLSIFAYENLAVLNDRIFAETEQRGTAAIAVDYNIAFDANAASFLRSAFDQRDNSQVGDLREFLSDFGGNRMNWDVRPYLHEHADSLLSNDNHIYETVLASERLAALDVRELKNSGMLTTNVGVDELRGRASIEMREFCRNLSNGGRELIAKLPLERAANISWDIYHMNEQHGMAMTSRKGAAVLIPAFHTADQNLGELWQSYPIRSCWAPGGLKHPYCESAIDMGQELSRLLSDDPKFVTRYFTIEARQRRVERLTTGSAPSIAELIQRLEHQLCS
jgi:hypothetical protein